MEAGDRTLVRYRMYEPELRPIPAPAEPLGAPEELRTTEELYLAATHLEQYRHATRDPADYYREGLRRDPTDLRLNDGYGLLLFRQGQIRQSIACFEKAALRGVVRGTGADGAGTILQVPAALKSAFELGNKA